MSGENHADLGIGAVSHVPFERTSVTAFNGKHPRCELREYVAPAEWVKAEWRSRSMTVRLYARQPVPLGIWAHIGVRSWGPTPLAIDGKGYRRRTKGRKP